MSQSLIIRDGNSTYKNLQVDSGSKGLIPNHTLVATVTGSNLNTYYTNGPNGWAWDSTSGSVKVAEYDPDRKGIIINNNSYVGKCYIIMGTSSFGTISNVELAPPKYTFMLDSGGTYFGEYTTACLEHLIYVASSSNIPNSSSMTVTVTQIY